MFECRGRSDSLLPLHRSVHEEAAASIAECRHLVVGKKETTDERSPEIALPLRQRNIKRCLIHVDDVAEVFARVALAKKPCHAIYNTGGENLSLEDIAGMVRNVVPDAEIELHFEPGSEDRTGAYMFDNSRLMTEFGFRYMPYQERVAQMIESVRQEAAAA